MYIFHLCLPGSAEGNLVLEAPWVGVRVKKTLGGRSIPGDLTDAHTSAGSVNHSSSSPPPQAGSLLSQPPLKQPATERASTQQALIGQLPSL